MSYMDWRILAQAAVDAGMDDGDGSAAMVETVIGALIRYVEQNGESMTAAEYLYILSATDSLDGAAAEGYSFLLYKMQTYNAAQFAYVVLEMLPEPQQGAILDIVRYADPHGDGVEYIQDAPSRESLIAYLELNLAMINLFHATDTEATLHGPGETADFRITRSYAASAFTFVSENPDIAAVDDMGLISAVSPGETNVIGAVWPGRFCLQSHL